MRKVLLVLVVAILSFALLRVSARQGGADTIAATAAELAPAEASAAERIVVLHRYVRDEIREVATQYG